LPELQRRDRCHLVDHERVHGRPRLAAGKEAYANIKASDVMVGID
jgi:hypothetical protein